MYLGTYEHSLDPKGRVILPAKFRDDLAEGAFLSRLPDGCLALYDTEGFAMVTKEMQEKAKRGALERNFARFFAAGAAEATPDRQGRITIPPHLRKSAHLERDVVVIGAITRIEIWDTTRWHELEAEAEGSMAAQPTLDDLGI